VGADGGALGDDAFDEGVESFSLFDGHDEDLAGETVAEGVVLDALFGLGCGGAFFAFYGFQDIGLKLEFLDEADISRTGWLTCPYFLRGLHS
jgi:hypothetical protein